MRQKIIIRRNPITKKTSLHRVLMNVRSSSGRLAYDKIQFDRKKPYEEVIYLIACYVEKNRIKVLPEYNEIPLLFYMFPFLEEINIEVAGLIQKTINGLDGKGLVWGMDLLSEMKKEQLCFTFWKLGYKELLGKKEWEWAVAQMLKRRQFELVLNMLKVLDRQKAEENSVKAVATLAEQMLEDMVMYCIKRSTNDSFLGELMKYKHILKKRQLRKIYVIMLKNEKWGILKQLVVRIMHKDKTQQLTLIHGYYKVN